MPKKFAHILPGIPYVCVCVVASLWRASGIGVGGGRQEGRKMSRYLVE